MWVLHGITDIASGFPLPDCSKLTINWNNDNDVIVNCFSCRASLVKLSYWSKFYVNIITGSGVMTIFVYKKLTRKRKIWNNPVWVLPKIWKLGHVRDDKLGTNVPNEMLFNTAKCQGYNFWRFWVIKGKPTGGFQNISK